MSIKKLFAYMGLFWMFGINASVRAETLDQAIRSAIAKNEPVKNVGVAVAVFKGGKLHFLKGYGLRDRAHGLAVTPDTQFVTGSMSKAFTALALVMAEEESQLNLLEPIQTYLKDFALENAIASENANTIDFLSHKSGLPRHDVFWYLSDYSREELLPRMNFLGFNKEPASTFRKSYQYNNLGYLAAGQVLEERTGMSWESVIQKKILDPLVMNDTTLALESLIQGADVSKGYWNKLELPYKDVTDIAAAAAVNSSAQDLAKWLGFLIRGGTTETGKRLVSAEGFQKLFLPQIETAVGSGIFYGLGWRLDKYNGTKWIRHAGNMDGFLGVISFLPEKGVGTLVLTNQNDSQVPSAVTLKILDKLLGKAVDPALNDRLASEVMEERVLLSSSTRRDAVSVRPSSNANEWIGNYWNPAYGDMKVLQSSDALELIYQSHTWPMKRVSTSAGSNATYTVLLDLGGRTQNFSLEFNRGGSGKAPSFTVAFEESAKAFRFERK